VEKLMRLSRSFCIYFNKTGQTVDFDLFGSLSRLKRGQCGGWPACCSLVSCKHPAITTPLHLLSTKYLQPWLTKKISLPLSLTMGLECVKVSSYCLFNCVCYLFSGSFF